MRQAVGRFILAGILLTAGGALSTGFAAHANAGGGRRPPVTQVLGECTPPDEPGLIFCTATTDTTTYSGQSLAVTVRGGKGLASVNTVQIISAPDDLEGCPRVSALPSPISGPPDGAVAIYYTCGASVAIEAGTTVTVGVALGAPVAAQMDLTENWPPVYPGGA